MASFADDEDRLAPEIEKDACQQKDPFSAHGAACDQKDRIEGREECRKSRLIEQHEQIENLCKASRSSGRIATGKNNLAMDNSVEPLLRRRK
jgi:hypothetical protein